MKTGVTTTMLIDCIAAIPSSGLSRLSAAITNVEKAKKTPATSPHPRAVASVAAEEPAHRPPSQMPVAATSRA